MSRSSIRRWAVTIFPNTAYRTTPIPAVNFHFGAVDPAKIAKFKEEGKELPTLHSSKFAPVPEPTIRTGVIGMTTAVLELMK